MPGLNWGEVNKHANESRGGKGGGFRFQVSDGETVAVRFLIPEDGNEPYIYKRHYVKNKGYHICAEDLAEDGKHAGCVICVEAKAQGKKGPVGLSQRAFAFSVFDPRKTHVFKEKVDGVLNGEKFSGRYWPCADGPTCKWCRKGDVPKVNGVRHWTLSGKVAQQLETWEKNVLGKTCASCGTGAIKVTGYECPECEADMEVDDADQESRCFNCSDRSKKKGGPKVVMVQPREVVTCKRGCTDARRKSLADAWIMVMRTGSQQDTTYNFTISDDVMELPDGTAPINFRTNQDFKPAPANEQAAAIGVANPFRGGRNHQVNDDDDDDDAPPFKKQPADDDDDDDDDGRIFGR